MSFTEAIAAYYRGYADFSGRTSRPGFWWVALYRAICYVTIIISINLEPVPGVILLAVYWLAHLVPDTSIGVRRLHDSDKSGWLIFLALAPFGGLIMLFLFLQPSAEWRNQWGDPQGFYAKL